MSFDLFTYVNCLLECLIMLILWRIADNRPFKFGSYLLAYVLQCAVAIPITFVDSVLFSILPVNFLLIFFCMWIGFRWHIKEAFLHSLFQFLLLLYIQCILCTLLPSSLFLTNIGNLIVNSCTLALACICFFLARRYRFSELLQRHATVVWTFFLLLCVPEILIVQIYISFKDSPSQLMGTIMLLLQTLYTVVLVLGFSLLRQRTERRQLADTQKYINDMNDHLEESRRSVHDFNKHIRYLRNMVAVESENEELTRRMNDYCKTMLDSYEKEELLLQLDDPVLRALLYGRRTQASLHNIAFTLEATPVLPVFPLKAHQVVEVFDNLIDNAFECIEELPEGERWIRISLSAKPEGDGEVRHILRVENPAPSVDIAAIMNNKTYTSKGGTHRGIGLRHTGRLVSDTGGQLIVDYQEGVFSVSVIY